MNALPMARNRRAGFIVAAAVLPLMLAGCQGTSGPGRGSAGGRGGTTVPVRTTQVQRISMQRQVSVTGSLLSPDQAKVSSEAAGVVRQVMVEIGQEVQAGQPLVRLEPRELALALERAESALLQTRAQLGMEGPPSDADQPPADEDIASIKTAQANREDARANFQRAENLAGRGLMAPADYLTAQTRLKVNEASYQAALDNVRALKASLRDRRAAYNLAQKKLNDATVKAPISGAVTERFVQEGEYISERTPVATIVQMNPLRLRTGVQEKYAGAIQPGQILEFRVESFGDQTFESKVAYVSPAIEQTMRTFTVEALVPNDDRRLKPGFFAKGVIYTKKDEGVMAIPDNAMATFAGVSSVYIVENDRIRQVAVTPGARQGDLWEVLDGLKGDETLATLNLNQLATGVAVRVLKPGESETAEPVAGAGRAGGRRGTGQGREQRGQAQPQGGGRRGEGR
jgi:RND family efflux transporter MFP subunit